MTEKEEEKTPLSVGIEIDPDGRVVFTDLPHELIDLVQALDPDAKIQCDMPLKSEEASSEQASEKESAPKSTDDKKK